MPAIRWPSQSASEDRPPRKMRPCEFSTRKPNSNRRNWRSDRHRFEDCEASRLTIMGNNRIEYHRESEEEKPKRPNKVCWCSSSPGMERYRAGNRYYRRNTPKLYRINSTVTPNRYNKERSPWASLAERVPIADDVSMAIDLWRSLDRQSVGGSHCRRYRAILGVRYLDSVFVTRSKVNS